MKEKYKKINYSEMSEDNFELKPYFKNLDLSWDRDKFRLRSKMTKTVKMNYPSDKGYKADLWSCWHCPSLDTQSHIMTCPAYQQFRENRNLDNDQELVKFFRQVIQLRDDMTTQWSVPTGHKTGCTSASSLGVSHLHAWAHALVF